MEHLAKNEETNHSADMSAESLDVQPTPERMLTPQEAEMVRKYSEAGEEVKAALEALQDQYLDDHLREAAQKRFTKAVAALAQAALFVAGTAGVAAMSTAHGTFAAFGVYGAAALVGTGIVGYGAMAAPALGLIALTEHIEGKLSRGEVMSEEERNKLFAKIHEEMRANGIIFSKSREIVQDAMIRGKATLTPGTREFRVDVEQQKLNKKRGVPDERNYPLIVDVDTLTATDAQVEEARQMMEDDLASRPATEAEQAKSLKDKLLDAYDKIGLPDKSVFWQKGQ